MRNNNVAVSDLSLLVNTTVERLNKTLIKKSLIKTCARHIKVKYLPIRGQLYHHTEIN